MADRDDVGIKYTKAECDYGPGDWPHECSTCAHFRTFSGGKCQIVTGKILGSDLCKFHVFKTGQEDLEDEDSADLERPRTMYEIMRDPKISSKKKEEINQSYSSWLQKSQKRSLEEKRTEIRATRRRREEE